MKLRYIKGTTDRMGKFLQNYKVKTMNVVQADTLVDQDTHTPTEARSNYIFESVYYHYHYY